MNLTSKQRRDLSRMAHDLSPVIYIGKNGYTPEVTAAAAKALDDHELIKVRFVEWKKSRDPISRTLAEDTHSALVRILGNTALFFRRNPDPEKRKITL